MSRIHPVRLAVALVVGGLSGGALHAQTSSAAAEEVIMEQASANPLVSLTGITRQEAVDQIYGRLWQEDRDFLDLALRRSDGNAVLSEQTGSENAFTVDQSGARNLAVLTQEGMQNTATVEQTGDDNVFGAWVTGDLNEIAVSQQGDGNLYLLDFDGDRLDHTVLQEGDGLQLIQTGEAQIPFSVEQRGNDSSITITHNGGQ